MENIVSQPGCLGPTLKLVVWQCIGVLYYNSQFITQSLGLTTSHLLPLLLSELELL